LNKGILHSEVQKFIQEHFEDDIHSIVLKRSPFKEISSRELAEQIDSKKRCELKLSLWFKTEGIYYPPKLSIEQASSEIAAKYKAELIEGNKIIDLTGGFGVDSYYFALKTDSVTHCELNKELSDISKFNSEILGLNNINYLNINGIEYLRTSKERFSTIYIDPSRRIESKKVFLLKDCEPNIIEHLSLLKEYSDCLIIKVATLLDIQSAVRELKHISEIHVISIKNECKELLIIIRNNEMSDDPTIVCALLNEKTQKYSFKLSEEKNYTLLSYSEPLRYIYEPDSALLKAGCFKLISRDFGLEKLHLHTHLYTSNELKNSFPGRKFKLKKVWSFGAFTKEHTFLKANIICRNFGLSPEELKKKLKIKDGGNEYLIFCTGLNNELLVINCDRIFNSNLKQMP
jgi:hypothetical protein